MGDKGPKSKSLQLPLNKDYQVKGTRDLLLKSRIEDSKIEILDGQSSNMMHTFALGNWISQISADKKLYKAGEHVSVFPF